ncbi:hypothetical protein QVD17_21384 [Tagetes erecta]|uniref:Uncharacterized protein n=1 Tax=Tagetes erecta TaxID=13708 RepID=A0AAD8KI64_TARER|nr:hypothetical protein QVD17_21384 [Tagetes erecta]
MHECAYTPKGSHANKLTDLVLCKIYKKESSQAINSYNQKDQQVENKRKLRDQEEAMQQQNQLHDHEHAPAKQPRVDQQVHHDHATNHHLGSNNVQEMGSMFQSNHVNNNIGSGMNAKFSVEALGGYNMDMNMINHMATPISM